MKILNLQAENVKRIKVLEITPDGNLVQVTGANGQGKTSVLDSIWWALAGAENIQKAPIRQGEEEARIRLDLGEIIVTRTFKQKVGEEGFTTLLTVSSPTGAKFNTPQKMINELLDSLSFDPLAFSRMKPEEQFNALRRFVPDVDFVKIEASQKGDYDARTVLNRRAKESQTLADSIVLMPDTPSAPVDANDLIAKMEQANAFNADIDTRTKNRADAAEGMEEQLNEAAEIDKKVAAMQQQAADLRAEATAMKEKLAGLPPLAAKIDVAAISQQLRDAEAINASFRKREEKAAHLKAAEDYTKQSEALTEIMAQREKAKLEAIAQAKLPVPGITFGDRCVLMNGVPFEQASDAEGLRASIAIAMASNPKLKVIRVRDGSLLDESSLNILAEMAKDKDFQVWIERVDSSGSVGFVMEDGHIKGQVIEPTPKKATEAAAPVETAILAPAPVVPSSRPMAPPVPLEPKPVKTKKQDTLPL